MIHFALLAVLAADPCEFKEGKTLPSIEATVFGGVEFFHSADPKFYQCGKKAGATLFLTWSIGEGGEFKPMEPKKLTSYAERESVPARDLCATPGLKQVQATLKGSGGFEKLDWSSQVVEVFCPKCPWSGADNSLALWTKRPAPEGQFKLDATFEKGWFACAETTGKLELHFFVGATREEVAKAKTPTHKVTGLTGPHVQKSFPAAAICKGKPAWMAYEFSGGGEFKVLPSKGRSFVESPCP